MRGAILPLPPARSQKRKTDSAPDSISAEHLRKVFQDRPVVSDISFSLRAHEAIGLLGPNGAGKTTVFYMISGLIRPDSGIVRIHGEDVTMLPVHRRARMGLGYLPQETSIFRGLSVEDNLRLVLEAVEPRREKRESLLESLLADMEVEHLRRVPAPALSGGERRRVEIARALAAQPRFILLDEPFAGIDPIALEDIRRLVRRLKDKGLGVLLTDHNVRAALDLVDRAIVIHDGKILAEGAPDEIVADSGVRRAYLGDRFSWAGGAS